MPFCQSCGKEVKEEDRFCPHCGATVAEVPKIPEVVPRREYRKEREACFGPAGSGVGLYGPRRGDRIETV